MSYIWLLPDDPEVAQVDWTQQSEVVQPVDVAPLAQNLLLYSVLSL